MTERIARVRRGDLGRARITIRAFTRRKETADVS